MKLANRNAIITGGSQGLGRTLVEMFVREGANVVFCARDGEAVARLERDLKPRADQRVRAQRCDVSSASEVDALFETAEETFEGPLHILVNNAGVYGPKGATEDIALEEWKRCIEINLYGTLIPSCAAIARFKKSGYGKIVNLSGGGATKPMPNISAYASSKAAVVRLTESLALELAPFHVDVNAVAPGALNTRLLDEVLAAGPEKVGAEYYEKARKQAREGGVPLEFGAELCVYLASAESDGLTGKLISAQWDPWRRLNEYKAQLATSDIYTLRRIIPEDRGENWPV